MGSQANRSVDRKGKEDRTALESVRATIVAKLARRSNAKFGEYLRGKMDQIIDKLQEATPSSARLLLSLLELHLDVLEDDWIPFARGEATKSIPYDRLEHIVTLFYRRIIDSYIGVDSHLPSFFMMIHPFLLDSLTATMMERKKPECHGRHVVRILPIRKKDLFTDFKEDEKKKAKPFDLYLSYHERFNIHLLRVDKKIAEKAQAVQRWTTDLGLWPRNCAVLFEPEVSPERRMRIQLVDREDTRFFHECVEYVKYLIKKARSLERVNGQLREVALDKHLKEDLLWSLEGMYDPKLAEEWPDFVDPEKRMAAKEGNFLLEQISTFGKSKPKILDAAAGIGAEGVFLKKKGCDVICNEIDWVLLRHATTYAQSQKPPVTLDIKKYDWRHFRHKLDRNIYDVVLVLGNSLTCLENPNEMLESLRGFHHVLKPNGRLIIDERNYPDMIKRRKEMQRPDYRFPGKVIYCGSIKARPGRDIKKGARHGTLEYYRGNSLVGTFRVYLFKEGEVTSLLDKAKFELVETRWDFEQNEDPYAEFITYVAEPES